MIFSPMVPGNGAYIVHANLSRHIPEYSLQDMPAMKTIFPYMLKSYRQKSEIVHTVPEFGDVFCNASSKSVVTFHNYFWDADYRPYCTFVKSLYYRYLQSSYVRKSILKADALVAVSEYTAGLVRASYPGVKVQVILNGVDTKRFSPGKNKPEAQLNILFSGNPTRRKGRHVLKAIADSLPEHAKLLVTGGLRKGEGDLRHPRIRFVGHIPYENMPDIYRKADILLLPSYREGLSLSALEGMASGLPVVSYDSSSMSELVVHGSGGYLSPVDDIKGIVTSISNLISAPNSLTEMGMFNRKRVIEHFDQQRMVAEYAALFHSM